MKDFPAVLVVVLLGAIAVFGGFAVAGRLEAEQARAELSCAVACNSKDVVIRNGRCGCISWKDSWKDHN